MDFSLLQPLWIDRRWNGGDYEKDSNSSEKKLLGGGNNNNGGGMAVNNNSDNEYAYIDRRNLTTFHSRFYENRSPEPYATTDIVRQQQHYGPQVRI